VSQRWALNLFLVAILAGLVALAWFKPGREKPVAQLKLTAIAADSIRTITLRRDRDDDVELRRDGKRWQLVKPRAARANPYRVNALLALLATESQGPVAAAPERLAEYGLDRPRAVARFDDAEIRLGKEHAFDPRVYVALASAVHLVPIQVADALTAPASDFLDTRLLNEETDLTEIRLRDFRVMRAENGAWQRVPALKGIAPDQANRFVEEWRHAQALSVRPYGGDRALDTVTIRYREGAGTQARGALIALSILRRTPELVILRPDENLEYSFPRETADRLLRLAPINRRDE
jgi:hypothetical protein